MELLHARRVEIDFIRAERHARPMSGDGAAVTVGPKRRQADAARANNVLALSCLLYVVAPVAICAGIASAQAGLAASGKGTGNDHGDMNGNGSCRVNGNCDRTPIRAGNWLLVGEPGARSLSLLDCPSGQRLASAMLSQPLAAEPVLQPMLESVLEPGPGRGAPVAAAHGEDFPRAQAILRSGELLSLGLPSLRPLRSRALPTRADQVAVSAVDGGLMAVGGSGEEPLRIVDAKTLSDVHIYHPGHPAVVGALAVIPGRSSFIAGLAEPAAGAEVWELALDRNAPPVLKGLVHDYRMGESVPLPGRFTPRVSSVASPTAAFVPGAVPYEWLRIDTMGNATVLHLEVRREIARLPPAPEGGRWLAAAWQEAQARGWLVGVAGSHGLQVFESGSWRLTRALALSGPLLAIRSFGDNRSVLVAVGREQGVGLVVVDAQTLHGLDNAWVSGPAGRVRLLPSHDGRCMALIDSSGHWLAAVLQAE